MDIFGLDNDYILSLEKRLLTFPERHDTLQLVSMFRQLRQECEKLLDLSWGDIYYETMEDFAFACKQILKEPEEQDD